MWWFEDIDKKKKGGKTTETNKETPAKGPTQHNQNQTPWNSTQTLRRVEKILAPEHKTNRGGNSELKIERGRAGWNLG